MRVPFFRIFYSTTFTILLIILTLLALVSPGDGIFQAYKNDQLWNVVIIAGVYLLVLLISIFIYATRLYTDKTYLASIPRAWIPVRKGEVPKSVREMILEGIKQSAIIAYQAHPRDLSREDLSTSSTDASGGNQEAGEVPHWGHISHPGWSSPSSRDLPHIQYEPVILELPHLIEAKAVSLAPSDPLTPDPSGRGRSATPGLPGLVVQPDSLAVELLQRPAHLNLRAYLSHLSSLGMIEPPSLSSTFLSQYEDARFGGSLVSEPAFRKLMATFTTLLRSLNQPSPEVLDRLGDEYWSPSTSNGSVAASMAKEESRSIQSGASASIHSPSEGVESVSSSIKRHAVDAGIIHSPVTSERSSQHRTPFFTLFATSTAAFFEHQRSASEGSLGGSEGSRGTVLTAPSRARPGLKGRHSSRSTQHTGIASRALRTPSGWSVRTARTARENWEDGEDEDESMEENDDYVSDGVRRVGVAHDSTSNGLDIDGGHRTRLGRGRAVSESTTTTRSSMASDGSVIRSREARVPLDLPYAVDSENG